MKHQTIFGSIKLGKEHQIVDGPDRYKLMHSLMEHDLGHGVIFRLADGHIASGIVAALEMDERVRSTTEMQDSFILILQTSGGARGGRVEYNVRTKQGKFWEIDPVHGPCL